MSSATDPTPEHIAATAPSVIPDNRVQAGQARYAEPTALADLVVGATHVRGIIGGLDHRGVEWLRWWLAQPQVQVCELVLAIYAGSPTWEDVLKDALEIQTASDGLISFSVLARQDGRDRPANLLLLQAGASDPGMAVTGNLGNALVTQTWDPTDAVLALPINPVASDTLRKWFDLLYLHSHPLNAVTAAAPSLRLPSGTEEGARLWRDYLDTLNGHASAPTAANVVNPTTGEVEPPAATPDAPQAAQAQRRTPSQRGTFPQPDPVLLAVQRVLAAGTVVTLEKVGRAPPLDMPVKASLLGQVGQRSVGAARQQQSFTVSLFDDWTKKRLDRCHQDINRRLTTFSLMQRDGTRWMPKRALPLFHQEMNDAQGRAKEELAQAIGGETPDKFVQDQAEKIAKDCAELVRQIDPNAKPSPELLLAVKEGLLKRLIANQKLGMVPNITCTDAQQSAVENENESPWGVVQNILASAARVPREAMAKTNPFPGLLIRPIPFLELFNVFDDPLVVRFLQRQRGGMGAQVKEELAAIDQILADDDTTPWHRAHALYRLITGRGIEHALNALTEERPKP